MRPGLQIGAAASVKVVVRPDMVAAFEELGATHLVYSTWNLVRHMEEASRKLILPYLDDDEDTIGHAVDVVHLSPALVGRHVEATAYLAALDGRRIVCDVTTHCQHRLIGRGRTVQMLVSRAWLTQHLAQLEQEQR